MRYFLFFILSINIFATPEQIEIVFLNHRIINSYLDKAYRISSEQLVQYDRKKCIPMGEGCFHPQYGMIPLEEGKHKNIEIEKDELDKVEINSISDIDTDEVKCKKENPFDIYCGKYKIKKRLPKYEVWIDTSSSFRNVDYVKEGTHCERRYFVSKLRGICGDKIKFSTFVDMPISLGSDQNLCEYVGINNSDLLLNAIKKSDTKYLLIITDIEEYKEDFRVYVDSIGAKLIGIGTKSITVDQLSNIYSPQFEKLCR